MLTDNSLTGLKSMQSSASSACNLLRAGRYGLDVNNVDRESGISLGQALCVFWAEPVPG